MKFKLYLIFILSFNLQADKNYKFFSQFGQDKYVYNHFFKNKKNGFYFDIGAFDGIRDSNTYFFEKYLNWKGICIEPTKYLFEQLVKQRKCVCRNHCIWKINGPAKFLEIKYNDGRNHGWSGLVSTYDPRHKEELLTHKAQNKETIVNCFTFNTICSLYKINHIDFLSVDTEGSELDILKSIDFDNIFIDVITVENNFNEPYIKKFLATKGFKYITRLGVDDLFRNVKTK